jgi:hypothetical protein
MEDEKYQQVSEHFANGAKARSRKGVYRSQKDWHEKGIIDFKRRVLGFCGNKSVKSLDELARILVELRVVDSPEEGRQFMKDLYGERLRYGLNGISLHFTGLVDGFGQEACKIERYDPGYPIFE